MPEVAGRSSGPGTGRRRGTTDEDVTLVVRPVLAGPASVPSPAVPRRSRPPLLAVLVLALSAVLTGCGGDDTPTSAPSDCTAIEDGAVTLVGKNLAWDIECLRVPEGTDVTFTVDLADTAVDHNLAISGPSGKAKTPLERGPRTQTLEWSATTAGYHLYVCDIHPTMEGDLWVDPPG